MAAQRPSAIRRPPGDDGRATDGVTAALAAWRRSLASERDALAALASARLLVPVVAVLAEADDTAPAGRDASPAGPGHQAAGPGEEKESEMALPTLIGNDGRAAIIAFTGLESLRRWRPDARPVPTGAARVWHAAVAEGQSVVIDVAGPVPLVVEGARLAALAAGAAPPPPHEDPDVLAAIAAAIAAAPGVTGFRVAASQSAELSVTLRAVSAEAARQAAQAIAAYLAPRFPRGVELTAAV